MLQIRAYGSRPGERVENQLSGVRDVEVQRRLARRSLQNGLAVPVTAKPNGSWVRPQISAKEDAELATAGQEPTTVGSRRQGARVAGLFGAERCRECGRSDRWQTERANPDMNLLIV